MPTRADREAVIFHATEMVARGGPWLRRADAEKIRRVDAMETQVNPKAIAATRDAKPPLHLLEHAADVEIARALQTGAVKYGERNYYNVPIKASVYAGAIRRHIGAWIDGEDDDPESGLSHLAHIGANVHILLKMLNPGPHDVSFDDDRGPCDRTPEQEQRSAASNDYVPSVFLSSGACS